MVRLLLLLLVLLAPTSLQARSLVADLSIKEISIDHNFNGIDVLVFGARNTSGTIVVVMRGPSHDYILRKKERIAGIWMNAAHAEFQEVPSFYAVASSHPLSRVNNEQLLNRLGIGAKNVANIVYIEDDLDPKLFEEAFISSRESNEAFSGDSEVIGFLWETLFKTLIRFPKNIERGTYTAEIYLFEDGKLAAMQSTPITVKQTGFAAFIYDLAHEHGILYGLVCIAIACGSAWLANAWFRRA